MMNSGEMSEFSLSFHGKYKHHRPEAALLRIAYLLAYSTFGFGFLINSNLQLIRDQIQSPHKRKLEHWGIFTTDYSDDMLGINIITKPKELQSFLVVFELKTPIRTTRHGVLLPGSTAPGLNIYKWLSKSYDNQKDEKINAVNIPDGHYLQTPNLAFASHAFWNDITNQ
jgi:hypothetical protein